MASLVVAGDVSGSVTLSAPSAAGSTVITLPTTSGTMVVTGGAQTVQFAAGSAAAPSITFTGDTNTGIFSPAADTIAFSEGGVESMRIDSSGNLNMSTVGGKVNFATTSSATVNYIGVPADGFSLELACQRGASQPFVYKLDFANGHIWSTAGSERMRIDSSGRVGIGVAPTVPLDLSSSLSARTVQINSTAANGVGLALQTSGTDNIILGSYRWAIGSGNATDSIMLASGFLAFGAGSSERMRINSTGQLLINASTDAAGAGARLHITSNTSQTACSVRAGTDGTPAWYFANSSGTKVGDIVINSGGTAYNTTSDYRLKENIAPMTGALAKVSQLKPVTYTWKSDGSAGQGFIAHELQAVVPDAVTGNKDAVDAEGKPVYQGIDTSFLVATLTAAIQELNAKVEAQAAEIAALKGAN